MRWIMGISAKKPKRTELFGCGKLCFVIYSYPQYCAQLSKTFTLPPNAHKWANYFIFNIRFFPVNSLLKPQIKKDFAGQDLMLLKWLRKRRKYGKMV